MKNDGSYVATEGKLLGGGGDGCRFLSATLRSGKQRCHDAGER
jgi:hypothetical protein